MTTHIARNDTPVIPQVTTLTPTAANGAVYGVTMNGKLPSSPGTFTADASAIDQEIVEGLQPILDGSTVPEFSEVTFEEDDAIITATGDDGRPFTIVDISSGGGALTVADTVDSQSPNHWIAENFDTGALPGNGDDVILQGLAATQSFKWNLDHNGVALASLDIRHDSLAEIGLPEINTDNTTGQYYQSGYRDTHLKIGTAILKIGDGAGQGSRRIKLDVGTTTACAATVFKTNGSPADPDEGVVHLVGGNAGNTLQVMAGTVDIAMLPGYTANWPIIIASGGTVRCGTGATLGVVEAGGSSVVETRSAVATLRTRGQGRAIHIGTGNITTVLDINGGNVEIRATAALTITLLNGYSGKTLDLTNCDANITVTDMNIYAVPGQPFTITDPNNRLVMTNAASTPNGAQSLVINTGSGRNVRIT